MSVQPGSGAQRKHLNIPLNSFSCLFTPSFVSSQTTNFRIAREDTGNGVIITTFFLKYKNGTLVFVVQPFYFPIFNLKRIS
jgi:hypothetical protein